MFLVFKYMARADIAPGPDGAATVYWVGSDAAPSERLTAPFRSKGYELLWAPKPEAAGAKGKALPDFLIVDLEKLGGRALDIFSALRKNPASRDCPILFLWTGTEPPKDLMAVLREKRTDALPKAEAGDLALPRMRHFLGAIRHFQLTRPLVKAAGALTSRDGKIVLDAKNGTCWLQAAAGPRDVALSPAERQILGAMMRRPNQTISLRDLLAHGWKTRIRQEKSQAIAQHIVRLRRKFGEFADRIETITRAGYRFRD